jgi:predicted 2-oxoglutarate/Fe(II)-dependent dioxygenase YbiX
MMSEKELLKKLGIFISDNFLEPEFCAEFRNGYSSAVSVPARVYGGAVDEGPARNDYLNAPAIQVNSDYRSTLALKVTKEVLKQFRERLFAIQPALENHFNVKLSGIQGPNFLRYRVGDFFKPHRDSNEHHSAEHPAAMRRISVIIFLNSQSGLATPDSYCGGTLNLFGLIGGPEGIKYGIKCKGEEGMLIAFPSATIHEVTTVTSGSRLSAASWFV